MTTTDKTAQKFTPFSKTVEDCELPTRFTFPYYYIPHPLALKAMEELQYYLEHKTNWQHDFTKQGMMFGVLVVKNQLGQLGYLSSYADNALHSFDTKHVPDLFVDAIFDDKMHHHYFSAQKDEITQLEQHIIELENAPDFLNLTEMLSSSSIQSEQEITTQQQAMAIAKKQRKQIRVEAESNQESPLSTEQLAQLISDLGNQSSSEKRHLKALKQHWKNTILELTEPHNKLLSVMKMERENCDLLSIKLGEDTLKACQFLNQKGTIKSLYDLFTAVDDESSPIPYSSEENAPKLLQTAFQMGLTPLALGEFWWGSSPYEQIRQHKNIYPACQSKSFEILEHMLEGIALDDNSLKETPSCGKELEIIYEDDAIVIVNKQAEFLSVPGKFITDSVQTRIKARYPNATGPLIVHRLDMSTSGLLVLTLTAETNKQVQKQFIERTVEKRYTALLEGNVESDTGIINLPLTGDIEDRPRQMVCSKIGRSAETSYQVISRDNNRTKIYLYPKTGRTHQLRVHCAHQAGLNTPIVGDDLYGFKDSRLHLHAGYLKFRHPVTNSEMTFEVGSEF